MRIHRKTAYALLAALLILLPATLQAATNIGRADLGADPLATDNDFITDSGPLVINSTKLAVMKKAFLDDGTGERLIGLTRAGDAACTQFGTALRVDVFAADFIEPYVAAAATAASPAPLDPTADFCASTCARDADCPPAMACLSDRNGAQRCGLPSLSIGYFAGACGAETDCGAGTCAFAGDSDCRCFEPCAAPVALTVGGSGGCEMTRAGEAASSFSLATLAAIGVLAARRRRSFGN